MLNSILKLYSKAKWVSRKTKNQAHAPIVDKFFNQNEYISLGYQCQSTWNNLWISITITCVIHQAMMRSFLWLGAVKRICIVWQRSLRQATLTSLIKSIFIYNFLILNIFDTSPSSFVVYDLTWLSALYPSSLIAVICILHSVIGSKSGMVILVEVVFLEKRVVLSLFTNVISYFECP